jgi:ElaB/YqjD/DUF883 family membrane-anchored ribosome-binding protein
MIGADGKGGIMNNTGSVQKKMRSDLKALMQDVEELVKATAEESHDGLGSLRRRIGQTLESAKLRLALEENALKDKSKQGAKVTAAYAQTHPWGVAGLAMGAVVILALLIWRQDLK